MAQRKIKKEDIEVEEQSTQKVERKPRWKVVNGGITLLDKRYFSKGETFEAEDFEVPMAFRDLVQCLDVLDSKPSRNKIVYSMEEIVPTAEEEDDDNYVQLYNIVTSTGKVISSKLTEEVAEPILKELNR